MEKKKKIFYLDFIRVISMLMIVTYHFYAHLPGNNIQYFNTIFSSGKWGLIGVSLFFMISGASLMYNYQEKMEIKSYAKKRFLGIYPMFWIAYILVFLHMFYNTKTNIWGFPAYRMIISLFAMDGYLSPYIATFYLIGEWFLGCIVIIYVLFPLIRKMVIKYPKTFIAVSTIVNLLVLIFYTNGRMPINQNLIVSLYSFILGMYMIKIKDFKWWHALIGLVVAIVGYSIQVPNMNLQVLVANITAYGLYITLAFIGNRISNIQIQRIFSTISKYSYAIFLVHHYLIMQIEAKFQGQSYGAFGTIMLYLTIWTAIAIASKILYSINKDILNFFKKEERLQIEEGEKRRN